jgi:hypothetical protein
MVQMVHGGCLIRRSVLLALPVPRQLVRSQVNQDAIRGPQFCSGSPDLACEALDSSDSKCCAYSMRRQVVFVRLEGAREDIGV